MTIVENFMLVLAKLDVNNKVVYIIREAYDLHLNKYIVQSFCDIFSVNNYIDRINNRN